MLIPGLGTETVKSTKTTNANTPVYTEKSFDQTSDTTNHSTSTSAPVYTKKSLDKTSVDTPVGGVDSKTQFHTTQNLKKGKAKLGKHKSESTTDRPTKESIAKDLSDLGADQKYKVQAGDTFWNIAEAVIKQYGKAEIKETDVAKLATQIQKEAGVKNAKDLPTGKVLDLNEYFNDLEKLRKSQLEFEATEWRQAEQKQLNPTESTTTRIKATAHRSR